MSPDEYQEAWQAEASRTRVKVDADLMLQEVRRAQERFRTMILMRDYREAGIAILLIPVWFFLGIKFSEPWTWYLTVPALIWVAGFIIVDRKRNKPKRTQPDDPLLDSARASLVEVEHQIWLLKNVIWWYLLPLLIPILVFVGHVVLQISHSWWGAIGAAAPMYAVLVALYTGIYYLNQYAVRAQLEPRRQELLTLTASLGEVASSEVLGEYPILMGPKRVACSPRRSVIAGVCAVLLLLIGLGGSIYLANHDGGYPKLAPFTDVRWGKDRPVVEIDGEFQLLFSIDGIDVDKIVAFCQQAYGEKWQKRFGEDLVQVLTEMGHEPKDTVRLDVLSTGPGAARTTKEVGMTASNRQKVRAAAEEREAHEVEFRAWKSGRVEPILEPDSSTPLAERLEGIRAANKLPAMAAFALRDGAIVERATVGTVSTKDDTRVTDDAQWHLGSNTKAMTATVVGMLVEEGLLRWDSTLGEALGKAAPDMNAENRDTTLAMLLHHRGGIAANINWWSAPEDRVACAAQILSTAPTRKGDYAYSNAGYVVVGAMMEAVTGKRWEDLMQEKLFGPLGMKDTDFGPPSRPGSPWGHESGLLGWKPMDPASLSSDNPPVMGPAGTVHTTMEDYSRFLAAQLKGAQGKDGIVKSETFRTLHTAADGGDYAMGWIVTARDWAGGRVLTHGGSNTLWYTTVWIAPEKDKVYFAATNAGGDTAGKAVNEAIELLIGRQTELR